MQAIDMIFGLGCGRDPEAATSLPFYQEV